MTTKDVRIRVHTYQC